MTKLRETKPLRRLAYFLQKPSVYGRLPLDRQKLEAARVQNRAFLRTVDCWIRQPDYENSIFQYGLPAWARQHIDAPMTEEVTYSDVIASLAAAMGSSLRYLEIGVSVGKNFSQVLHHVRGAELACFDIESINPVLSQILIKRAEVEWETSPESMRKEASRLTEYVFEQNNNKVRYLAGDVFDDRSWGRLRGQSFNLVFSDAFHSADAMLKEWEMIKAHDLLAADGFIVLWDDLGAREMRDAFYTIVEEMRIKHSLGKADAGIEFYRGWLGEREPYHPVGFIRMPRRWR